MDLDKYGTPNIFSWDHEYLVRVLTTGKNRISNTRLIPAIKRVKREDFVSDEHKEFSYHDKELEIGFSQKISRPTITVQMIELLNPKAGGRVLEVGTGSGYSAALLALTVGDKGRVFTIENQQYLIDQAKTNIRKYEEIKNVEIFFKDGLTGLPQRAPFDSIFIGASIDSVSNEMKNQMNIGGSLVAPLKDYRLLKLTRTSKDSWEESFHEGFILDEIKEGIN